MGEPRCQPKTPLHEKAESETHSGACVPSERHLLPLRTNTSVVSNTRREPAPKCAIGAQPYSKDRCEQIQPNATLFGVVLGGEGFQARQDGVPQCRAFWSHVPVNERFGRGGSAAIHLEKNGAPRDG